MYDCGVAIAAPALLYATSIAQGARQVGRQPGNTTFDESVDALPALAIALIASVASASTTFMQT
jgi:hypothetical protein